MNLKKCFGIISGFSDDQKLQHRRIKHFEALLHQLSEYWPDVDILVIAQNWKDYQLPEIKNQIIKASFDKLLGITEARKTLREEFLKRDYDYIIMLDDDAILQCDNAEAPKKFIEEIDNHPTGFCIPHSENHWHHHDSMARSPLNLFAISRDLFEKEPMVNVSIEKFEAMEDDLYAELIYHKYKDLEFKIPDGLYHTHSYRYMYLYYMIDQHISPPTWFRLLQEVPFHQIWHNTNFIIEKGYEVGEFDLEKLKQHEKWHTN